MFVFLFLASKFNKNDFMFLSKRLAMKKRYNRFKAGHPQGFMEAFANYYADISDCLTQYKINGEFSSPYVFGADISAEGLKFLEAISESARTKTLIKF